MIVQPAEWTRDLPRSPLRTGRNQPPAATGSKDQLDETRANLEKMR